MVVVLECRLLFCFHHAVEHFCFCFKVQSRCRWLKGKKQITQRERERDGWSTGKPRSRGRDRGLAHTSEKPDWRKGAGWRMEMAGVWVYFGRRLIKEKNPIQSSPVLPIQLQSLPGLVEEDVSRLRVLGDVWGKTVKLLDGLRVDFLHDTSKDAVNWKNKKHTRLQMNKQMSQGTLSTPGLRVSVTHLHDVIIKQQPEAVALHYGDVMTSIWATEETETDSDSIVQMIFLSFLSWQCSPSSLLSHIVLSVT